MFCSRYIASAEKSSKVIGIETLKDISKGEEFTVFYSDEYLDQITTSSTNWDSWRRRRTRDCAKECSSKIRPFSDEFQDEKGPPYFDWSTKKACSFFTHCRSTVSEQYIREKSENSENALSDSEIERIYLEIKIAAVVFRKKEDPVNETIWVTCTTNVSISNSFSMILRPISSIIICCRWANQNLSIQEKCDLVETHDKTLLFTLSCFQSFQISLCQPKVITFQDHHIETIQTPPARTNPLLNTNQGRYEN